MTVPLLALDEVAVRYGDHTAVSGISFSVAPSTGRIDVYNRRIDGANPLIDTYSCILCSYGIGAVGIAPV